jgi:hypothetical protein
MTTNPNKIMVLRFRDLVTDLGGTIAEHRSILRSYRSVWWGWMMRQQEHVPRPFLCELKRAVAAGGTVTVLLYDTGQNQLYRCALLRLAVAPPGIRIASPEPEKTPEYYNRGRYPAWFCFTTIDETGFSPDRFYFDSFPTRPEGPYLDFVIDQQLKDLQTLRQHDVTLWVLRERRDA